MMPHTLVVVLRRIRIPLIVMICVYSISTLGFVLIPGEKPDGSLWRMDFFHAFYFVSFMGSTIGFGEIPYPFNGAQRMWTLFSIYSTVVSWLYAIGTSIAMIQDPVLRAAWTRNAFRRRVRHLREPFYIVCGAGDTGKLLVRALAGRGIRTVAVDSDPERIAELETEDLGIVIPALCADATDSAVLTDAGLRHPWCSAVVALTQSDFANLKIAISCKLLAPATMVISRTETRDVGFNLASFGTDHIINPYDSFADYLGMALTSPGHLLLHEWLTSAPGSPLQEPLYPPRGRWILCGFGRFGKAIRERLEGSGSSATVIEISPGETDAPPGTIVGRGTEAGTLIQAGIHNAAGIVAGTDNDPNNLSIVMTARELNDRLFRMARQNRLANDAIFQAAGLDVVTHHSEVIARRILALITTPLTAEFLELAGRQDASWTNELIARICGVVTDRVPHTWVVVISNADSPAVMEYVARNEEVRLEHLLRDANDRKVLLPAIPLLVKRPDESVLLPDHKYPVRHGDRLLFCGQESAARRMWLVQTDPVALAYTRTGKHLARGWLWRWLSRRATTQPA